MFPTAMSDASAPRHVLYVEDDRINIVLMEEVFRLMPGWVLHIAETGAQAMEMLPQVMPTLVLMDMNLPDMNGLQLMGLVKADPRLAQLRCVALSVSRTTGSSRLTCVNCGWRSKNSDASDLGQVPPGSAPPIKKPA